MKGGQHKSIVRMVFHDGDQGPFWMSDAERAKRKYENLSGSKEKQN
jgi:hypothetical protein